MIKGIATMRVQVMMVGIVKNMLQIVARQANSLMSGG
jgi:hypothetical protein